MSKGQNAYNDLLKFWDEAVRTGSDYIHKNDKKVIRAIQKKSKSKEELIFNKVNSDFTLKELKKLEGQTTLIHSQLYPSPYAGNILKARIYYLTGNPGYEHGDYSNNGPTKVLKTELELNLKQQTPSNKYPFFPLNPKFAFSGGYRYWTDRLSILEKWMVENKKYSEIDAHKWLSKNFAVLELTGNSSKNMERSIIEKLPSRKLMIRFFFDYVLPRAKRGQCIIVLARSRSLWLDPIFKFKPNDCFFDFSESMNRNGRIPTSVIIDKQFNAKLKDLIPRKK